MTSFTLILPAKLIFLQSFWLSIGNVVVLISGFELAFYIFIVGFSISCGIGSYSYLNGHNRIIGGTNTYGWRYPWYGVLLSIDDNFQANCGASLISARHFLTAAHCFDQYRKKFFNPMPFSFYYNFSF